jgi:hypothetical protein
MTRVVTILVHNPATHPGDCPHDYASPAPAIETGSAWDILGRAVAGELAGRQLTPIVSVNHFWFLWAAFKPETRVYQP